MLSRTLIGSKSIIIMKSDFQRRHYEQIANVFGEHLDRIVLSGFNRYRKRDSEQIEYLINNMISMFKRDNPNFNEERFLKFMKSRQWVNA